MRNLLKSVIICQILLVLTIHCCGAEDSLIGKPGPKLEVGAWVNSPPQSLAKLKGKIVVLEFFGSDGFSSMNRMRESEELYKENKDKGVVFIGITEQPKDVAIKNILGGKSRLDTFTMAIASDGKKAFTAYNVAAMPHVTILDPAGNVAWEGKHPKDFEDIIEKQMKKTPPSKGLSKAGQELADLANLIEAARKDVEGMRYSKAISRCLKVKEADGATEDMVKAADEILEKLEEEAKKLLEEARKLYNSKTYGTAISKLKEIQGMFAGLETAKKAQELLKQMLEDPAVAAIMQAHENEESAARLMRTAEKLYSTKRYAEALKRYEKIAEEYPDTKAGKSAAAKAEHIRSNPTMMKQADAQKAARECASLMSMAQSYIVNKKYDKARGYLQKVIDGHPGTEAAEKAQDILKDLPKK